jgi:hypothetical protein
MSHACCPPQSLPPGARRQTSRRPPAARYWHARGRATSPPSAVCFYADKLTASLSWWKENGASRRTISTIATGVTIPWAGKPPARLPQVRPLSVAPEDETWLLSEVERLDTLGVFRPATCSSEPFRAQAFIATNAAKRRLVVNLKPLNAFCGKPVFTMEGVKELAAMIKPDAWLWSTDLKDAYYALRVAPQCRRYFSFKLLCGGVLIERDVECLSFGWCCSPRIFTKVIRAFVTAARRRGIATLAYLDDLAFSVHGSKEQALEAQAWVTRNLAAAGLTVHPTKGQHVISHCLTDHLGYAFCSESMKITVPSRRCYAVKNAARALIVESAAHQRWVSAAALRSFVGSAQSCGLALRAARFHLRSLHDATPQDTRVRRARLSAQAITDLRWWTTLSPTSPGNGAPMRQLATSLSLCVDASGRVGWGCQVLPKDWLPGDSLPHPSAGEHAEGFWTRQEKQEDSISLLELRAVRHALSSYRGELQDQHLHLWEDNMSCAYALRHGTTRSPEMMRELRLVWAILERHNISLEVTYVASALNPSDFWSRWRPVDAWQLRPVLFSAVTGGRCTLDAFACTLSAQLPRYCSRGPDPRSLARDAFLLPWRDEFLWLNPPWALISRTLNKLEVEGARGYLVHPHWPSAAWWPALQALTVSTRPLPPPRLSVLPLHAGATEPFRVSHMKLCVTLVDGSRR